MQGANSELKHGTNVHKCLHLDWTNVAKSTQINVKRRKLGHNRKNDYLFWFKRSVAANNGSKSTISHDLYDGQIWFLDAQNANRRQAIMYRIVIVHCCIECARGSWNPTNVFGMKGLRGSSSECSFCKNENNHAFDSITTERRIFSSFFSLSLFEPAKKNRVCGNILLSKCTSCYLFSKIHLDNIFISLNRLAGVYSPPWQWNGAYNLKQ